jgi:hypothetical protein
MFRERGWLSLFELVNAYLGLVNEFYMNMDKISMTPLSFVTSISGTKIKVTAELLPYVTHIELEPNPSYPFPSPNHPNWISM